MKYKVAPITNIRQVNYLGMAVEERKKVYMLNDLCYLQMHECFDDDYEYYALYEDMDNPMDENVNECSCAVYLGKSRMLLCLLHDVNQAICGCDDTDYYYKRAELYKQIALAAGWPEKLPPQHMTWRDLLNELHKQPDDVLNMPAYVNVTQETWTGLHEVTSLTTWNGEGEVDLKENQLLINFVEDSWMD